MRVVGIPAAAMKLEYYMTCIYSYLSKGFFFNRKCQVKISWVIIQYKLETFVEPNVNSFHITDSAGSV